MKLTQTASIVAFAKFAEKFGGMLILAVLARVLVEDDYGTYRSVWYVGNLVGGMLVLGMPSALMYLVPTLGKKAEKEPQMAMHLSRTL